MDKHLSNLNLEYLFKLRLAIARLGEMDNAAWWNTKGLLSSSGSFVFRRGFPRTHAFAQARVAFAVASARCQEVYDVPGAVTLWNLGAVVEDQFEEASYEWLDDVSGWQPFFEQVGRLRGTDVFAGLRELDLIGEQDEGAARRLRLVGENRGVALPTATAPSDATITLLASGFGRGQPGMLAVPYLPIANERQ